MKNDNCKQNGVAGQPSECISEQVRPVDAISQPGERITEQPRDCAVKGQMFSSENAADAFYEAVEAAGLDKEQQQAICASYVESIIEDVVFCWVDEVDSVDHFLEYVEGEIESLRLHEEAHGACCRQGTAFGESEADFTSSCGFDFLNEG